MIEVRALTRDDLGLLDVKKNGDGAVGDNRVQRLRDPHHRLARLIASGARMAVIVERSGYSYARVQTLQKDPAFIELVAKYRERVDESFTEEHDHYHEMLFTNMIKAERMLAEKLEAIEEDGETLPTRDLIAISRDAADRLGYGKRQMNINANVDFAANLEAAVARSRSARVIEGKAVASPALAPQSPQVVDVPAAQSPGVSLPPTKVRRI